VEERVPTSAVLDRLLEAAAADEVTLAWVIEQLQERSFGIVILLLALIGLLPGASLIAAALLAVPAIQMMRARLEPILPTKVMQRRVRTPRLAWLVCRLTPVLRRLERVVRPRWRLPPTATKRAVGGVILLMSATIASPVPFSQVIPLFVILLIAFAYLEEDGMLLCIGMVAALISCVITGATIWGAVETGRML
jgi:hypothetical protein